jgi:hypothetical protein
MPSEELVEHIRSDVSLFQESLCFVSKLSTVGSVILVAAEKCLAASRVNGG